MTARAKAVVEPVLADEAEFLPLACPDMPLWLVNNLQVIDALDEEHSEIRRYPDGRIVLKQVDMPSLGYYAIVASVLTPVFHRDPIQGRRCFTVPQEADSVMYFTEPVADAIKEAGLTGLDLDQPVWTGEDRG